MFLGTFTSQTDVWAFGVTLWEIFTFARDTPYSNMTDQQVIDNACSVVAKQGRFKYLPQPNGCPSDVYYVMLQCWQRTPEDRPKFSSLYKNFESQSSLAEVSI